MLSETTRRAVGRGYLPILNVSQSQIRREVRWDSGNGTPNCIGISCGRGGVRPDQQGEDFGPNGDATTPGLVQSANKRVKVKRPNSLSELYPRGTPMSEVDPDFRGMLMATYRALVLKEDIELDAKARAGKEAPLSNKRIWTPRDDYGMKGL